MTKDERLLLHDMLDAARLAHSRAKGRTREDLENDLDFRDATVRRIQVIGEAASALSDAFRDDHPQVPWRKIMGTRHRVVHEYRHVDYDIVWEVVTARLPELIDALEAISREVGDEQ